MSDGQSGGESGSAGGGATAGSGAGNASAGAFTVSPGLRRLTRAEYANTVFDLLGVTVVRDEQPRELIVQGHSQIALAQKTGYDDNNRFVELGEKAATAASAMVAGTLNCSTPACYKTFATGFLTRAFRAPPAVVVVDRYAAILTAAEAGETPTERVTAFLSAVLTSPHFLYKKELGTAVVKSDTSLRSLDGHEIATRLSYLVWQSMPDPELMTAAAGLTQAQSRATQFDRMLKDKRAQRGLRAFVADWMGLFENNLPKKDATILQGTSADFAQVAERSFELFVDEVLASAPTAKITDLLTADFAFANAELGKVLGAVVAGADLKRTPLDTGSRRGLLTQSMVIGAHSKESGASPFPIGKFVFENLLCESIPPPEKVPAIADDPSSALTLRQRLEAVTAAGSCVSCHSKIGPTGFAFLPYDPIGRYTAKDPAGRPFDTKGELVLGDGSGTPVLFDGASDLAAKLAAQTQVKNCVARRFFRWAFGRFETGGDDAALTGFEKAAATSDTGVAEVLRALVSSPTFAQVRVSEGNP